MSTQSEPAPSAEADPPTRRASLPSRTGQGPDHEPPQDDSSDLSFPFSTWLRAAPDRPVLAAGYGLVLVQLLLRGWVKLGGWFVGDDFSFMGRAFSLPFDLHYLTEGWHGHFMPGAFAQVRVFMALWPFEYVPVALFDLALQALTSVLMLRLLVNLFGARHEILLPMAFYVLTPMTLPAFLWWAAGLNQLWGQLAMVFMLLAHLRYHRAGRLRDGLLGVAAMVFGLLFSEKLLLMAPVVAAMTLFWFTPGRPLPRLMTALQSHKAVWAAYGTVVVGYVLFYRMTVPAPLRNSDNWTVTVQTIGTGLVDAVVPAVFGGPFTWHPMDFGGIADPQRGLVIVLLMAVALIIWISVWRAARASFGWIVVFGYHVINAAILGATRASWVGAVAGTEYRYHTDLAVIIATFAPMAFLPLLPGAQRGVVQKLRPRRPAQLTVPFSPGVTGAMVTLLTISCTISTMAYDPLWRGNRERPFFENVARDLRSVDHPITVNDYQMLPLFGYTETYRLLRGFTPVPDVLRPGASAERVFLPDPEGNLRLGKVEGFRNKEGPEPGCGYRLGSKPTNVPLDLKTMDWAWTARINYVATYPNEISVTAGKVTTKLPIKAGAHSVFVIAQGAIDKVSFSAVPFGTICVDDIEVGNLVPTPGTSPESVDGPGT